MPSETVVLGVSCNSRVESGAAADARVCPIDHCFADFPSRRQSVNSINIAPVHVLRLLYGLHNRANPAGCTRTIKAEGGQAIVGNVTQAPRENGQEKAVQEKAATPPPTPPDTNVVPMPSMDKSNEHGPLSERRKSNK